MEPVNFDIFNLSDKMIDFCERNNISQDDLNKISNSDMAGNQKVSIINPVISLYGIREQNQQVEEDIYIRDIVGFEPYDKTSSLFKILGTCYSDGTETYGLRANEKLKLTKDQIIQDMEHSFSFEPIQVDEIEGKKLVSHNGCHRASLLRLLYIDEVLKREKPIEEIDEKYKIRAKVSRYDMTLTYIHFFLKMMNAASFVRMEYDCGRSTGNYIVESKEKNSKLSRDELINLFNETLNNNMDKIDTYYVSNLTSIPSFKKFLKDYIPELSKENEYGNSRNYM